MFFSDLKNSGEIERFSPPINTALKCFHFRINWFEAAVFILLLKFMEIGHFVAEFCCRTHWKKSKF